MVERLTTSIVLYGEIGSLNSNKWLYFYNYVLNFIKSINLSSNYMAVSSESIKSSKISPIRRGEKNLLSAIENKEEISSLSIYSLPDNFETAAYDYNAYICRTNRLKYSHIIITLPIEIYIYKLTIKIELNKETRIFSELEPINNPNHSSQFYFDRAAQRMVRCLVKESTVFPEKMTFESPGV
ncbi:hypothetical protein [Sporosarcina cyprini]|uniref:hypothetical protein n=1 Tax=Sporosarcina cyprini TaxID=2910523 RepID=UPI001EDE5808|nr:hypothetical protein [Sporosarcina cyprini]MCG3086908.1 hypothetical protein [Sporosarcina cyprini]